MKAIPLQTPIAVLLSFAMLAPAAAPAAAEAEKIDPVTITVIAECLAIAGAAVGINYWLTKDAAVFAQSKSGGPDLDDRALNASDDVATTFLETELEADTRDGNSIILGLNGTVLGSLRPSQYHSGYARMDLESSYTESDWRPVARGIFAYPKPDSTPVPGSDNKTTVHSIAFFRFLGQTVEEFTIVEQAANGKVAALGVALAPGRAPIAQRSSGAMLWDYRRFALSEDAGNVTITPPASAVPLFHDFVQLGSSAQYRLPDGSGLLPGSDPLAADLAAFNAAQDAATGAIPLTGSDTVDFTLGAATLLLDPVTLPRDGRTDRELVEEYLASDAVRVEAPAQVQAGYTPDLATFSVFGGAVPAPDDTLFAEQGGLDQFVDDLEDGAGVDPADLVGLLVETEADLVTAMNMAALDASSDLYALLNAKAVGDKVSIPLTIQQTNALNAAGERNTTACIDDASALFGVFSEAAGEAFAETAIAAGELLETGVATANSNPSIAERVPECVTEISEEAGGVSESISAALAKSLACGDGPSGRVVCAATPLAPPDGEWMVLGMVLGGVVTAANPEDRYQFGFVFDSDAREDNDWVAAPQFANDYYQDTDRWYSVEYAPGTGWSLAVTQVDDNLQPQAAASAARAVISGNTITLIAPLSEFESASPRYRLTAFRHEGDFGQNPPYVWSADYHPRLGEALAAVPGLEDRRDKRVQVFGCGTRPATAAAPPWGDGMVCLAAVLSVLLARRRVRAMQPAKG